MNNRSEGMSWFENMYSEFEVQIEAMSLEMDGIVRQQQEGFQYVENKLQTVGASVKQFFSDFVQEILPQCSYSSEECASESFLAQNTDEANQMSKEIIDEDQLENKPCNECQLHHSMLEDPENVTRRYPRHFSAQEITDLINWIKENPYEEKRLHLEISDGVTSYEKNPSLSVSSPTSDDLLESSSYEEKQLHLEISDGFTSDKKNSSLSDLLENSTNEEKQLQPEMSNSASLDKENPSFSVLSPTSGNLLESSSFTKMIPLGFASSDSVSSVYSFESEILGVENIYSDAPAESIGKSDKTTDNITNVGSSHKIELDESCIIVDSSEISYVSHEAATLRSYKEKLEPFVEAEGAVKLLDDDQHAACPDSESTQQEREGPVFTKSDHELCESDWVIV